MELKRELYAMLSSEVARQLKKRGLTEQKLLTDFGEWRKKRREARRRR
jgi:hypothetical protein